MAKIEMAGWQYWSIALVGGIIWIVSGLFAPVIPPEEQSRSFLICGGVGLVLIGLGIFVAIQKVTKL